MLALSRGRAKKRDNDLCPPFYLRESCPPAPALMPDTSVPPCMSLVPFKLLPRCWSSEGVSLSKSLWGPLRGLLEAPEVPSTDSVATGFSSQKVRGLHLPGAGTLGWEAWCGAGTPCFLNSPPDFYPPHVSVGPAHSTSLPLLEVSMYFLL